MDFSKLTREELEARYAGLLKRHVINYDLVQAAVRRLHESPVRVVLGATGAGAGIQDVLWGEPGASSTLLEAKFTYAMLSTDDFIGQKPARSYCSGDTAEWMASAAYNRAFELAFRSGEHQPKVMGLGVTAAVATGRVLKGGHRAFICVRTSTRMCALNVTFTQGLLDRKQEGQVCNVLSVLALDALNSDNEDGLSAFLQLSQVGSGLAASSDSALGLTLSTKVYPRYDEELATVWDAPLFWPDGTRSTAEDVLPTEHLLFPGSFNPLHHGHLMAARAAAEMTGKKVIFETTAKHPDKGNIEKELLSRAEQFRWRHPVLFTKDGSLYIDKARRLPGIGFLMGGGVIAAIMDSKYYGSIEARDAVLDEFHRLGTKFYVNGRYNQETGVYETIDNLPIPLRHKDLFVQLSGRWDVSSSSIRKG